MFFLYMCVRQNLCIFLKSFDESDHIIGEDWMSENARYCRSSNICWVSIFANFARRTNSRMQECRENYTHNSATKENENSRILNFVKSPNMRNSRKFKHANIIRSTVCVRWENTATVSVVLNTFRSCVLV